MFSISTNSSKPTHQVKRQKKKAEETHFKNPFTTEIYKTHFERLFGDDNSIYTAEVFNFTEKENKEKFAPEESNSKNENENEQSLTTIKFPIVELKKKIKKLKKSKNRVDERFTAGRWTLEEHQRFIEAILLYSNDWKKIENYIGTRNSAQARSHAQKFFEKMKLAGIVDEDFNLDNKTSIKSLHLVLKEFKTKKNPKMDKVLNSLAFERKNSKRTKRASFSEEDQKTMDNSSDKMIKQKIYKDKRKKANRVGKRRSEQQAESRLAPASKLELFEEELQTTKRDRSGTLNTLYSNNDLLNSYNKLGLINKINNTNLKKKRSRIFSQGSMDLNWLEREPPEKDEVKKVMLVLFDENASDVDIEEYEENLFYNQKLNKNEKLRNRLSSDLSQEDVIQKFLNHSSV